MQASPKLLGALGGAPKTNRSGRQQSITQVLPPSGVLGSVLGTPGRNLRSGILNSSNWDARSSPSRIAGADVPDSAPQGGGAGHLETRSPLTCTRKPVLRSLSRPGPGSRARASGAYGVRNGFHGACTEGDSGPSGGAGTVALGFPSPSRLGSHPVPAGGGEGGTRRGRLPVGLPGKG